MSYIIRNYVAKPDIIPKWNILFITGVSASTYSLNPEVHGQS